MEIATELMINEEIRDREVRVIDENGDQLGVMSIQQALTLAEDRGLDLAKIQPMAKPPVLPSSPGGRPPAGAAWAAASSPPRTAAST